MLLIFSEENDLSTKKVINWLLYYNVEYVLVNECDYLLDLNLTISNNSIDFFAKFTNGKEFRLSEISCYWHRRGMINKWLVRLKKERLRINKEWHLSNEWKHLQSLLHYIVETKEGIGNFEVTQNFKKLYQLVIANEVGLRIPDSFISNNSISLIEFINKNEVNITKNLEREFIYSSDTFGLWTSGTNIINEEHVHEFNGPLAFPSLIQKGISKKYELRTFFLDGKMWSMCIFHNSKDKEIDYRAAGDKIRMVPYYLPLSIEEKICSLMKKLGLNCGSIDLLAGYDGEYYFLEVNPVGQYDFVSVKCNYNLDREIARYFHKIYNAHELH